MNMYKWYNLFENDSFGVVTAEILLFHKTNENVFIKFRDYIIFMF